MSGGSHSARYDLKKPIRPPATQPKSALEARAATPSTNVPPTITWNAVAENSESDLATHLTRFNERPPLAFSVLLATRVENESVHPEVVASGVSVRLVGNTHTKLRVTGEHDLSCLKVGEPLQRFVVHAFAKNLDPRVGEAASRHLSK